jgi:hypothetical protein
MPRPWKPTEPSRFYRHLKAVFGDPSLRTVDARRRRAREVDADSVPYGRGREPKGLGDVVGSLADELGSSRSRVPNCSWTGPASSAMSSRNTPAR